MKLLGHLIIAVATLASKLINLYTFVVVGAVIVSLVNADPTNPIVRFLRQATEPVLYRVRRFIPRSLWKTGLDLSPLIVLILLFLIDTVVVTSLIDLGRSYLSTR